MNFISKTLTRFYEWIYHPAFRYHKPSKAFVSRYPSPASVNKTIELHNYKEPYTHSYYNVRFRQPTIHQAKFESSIFAMDNTQSLTIAEKLIRAKILKAQDENNKEAIEVAKTQWFRRYKTPVEQKIYKNDFGWQIPDYNNPETFRYLIDMRIKVNTHTQKILRGDDNIDRIYDAKVPEMEGMCYYAGDPEFQQMLIEVFYKVEGFQKENIKRGSIPIFSGNRNFWKAFDSINDSENVLRVESHINDPNPLDFSLHNDKKGDRSVKVIQQNGEVRIQAP